MNMEFRKNIKAYFRAAGISLAGVAAMTGINAYPKIALIIAGVGALLVGLSINLPDPPAPPAV